MHIVINISEKVYKRMKLLRALSSDNECLKYILEGTPLPKGHGRLIDADKLKEDVGYTGYNYDFQNCLDDAPTIIEADQEDNEAYRVSIPECFDSNRAIKALNNIPTVQAVPTGVIDKIRTEIEQIINGYEEMGKLPYEISPIYGLHYAIQIIDKYKAESEE